MVGEGGGNALAGLAERAGLGPELAAVLLEGGTNEFGDCCAFCGRAEPDRDVVGAGGQMPGPVCSGRWSSATKSLNLVVSPSNRSITLLIGPWRCFATMI